MNMLQINAHVNDTFMKNPQYPLNVLSKLIFFQAFKFFLPPFSIFSIHLNINGLMSIFSLTLSFFSNWWFKLYVQKTDQTFQKTTHFEIRHTFGFWLLIAKLSTALPNQWQIQIAPWSAVILAPQTRKKNKNSNFGTFSKMWKKRMKLMKVTDFACEQKKNSPAVCNQCTDYIWRCLTSGFQWELMFSMWHGHWQNHVDK